MSKFRVRFAPSPTGPLHIGGVRTALYNFLLAKQNGGDFILRIEDTDQARFVDGAEEYIKESLSWLGIFPDEGPEIGGEFGPYRQSERKDIYKPYVDQMIQEGNAYYAFDTVEELDQMRERMKKAGMQPRYDVTSRMSMKNSLTLSQDEVNDRLARGMDYVVRVKMPRKQEIKFYDEIRGYVQVQSNQIDDKVILKSDGLPTYHLANVVDDHLMKISHIIRGEEWLPSAPLHIMLYHYLGWENTIPKMAHLPLILKPEGKGKLSKRDGDRLGFPVFPIDWFDPENNEKSSGYREYGYFPEAVLNILALLGWHSSDNKELFSLSELVQHFSLKKVNKAGARFDAEKAKWFNHQYLLGMSENEILKKWQPILKANSIEKSEDYLLKVIHMIKDRVNFLNDFLEEGNYFFAPPVSFDPKGMKKKWKIEGVNFCKEFLDNAAKLEEFTADNLQAVFDAMLKEKEIGVGQVMPTMRLAITGRMGGPPIFDILSLLGINEVQGRFSKAIEMFPV